MRLIHEDTYRDTQDAIQGCRTVAYTSVDVPANMTLTIVPPVSDDNCTIVFVSSQNTSTNITGRHISIVHKRTADTWHMSARKFSKVPKLCPHLLFGNRTSVFFDSKLRMQVGLKALHGLSRDGQLTAFRHPRCPKKTCDPYDWALQEGKLVARTSRVDNQSLLASQIKRYRAQVSRDNKCKEYIDGALLIQRNAQVLFQKWSQLFTSNISADRDQIAFAEVAASACFKMRILETCVVSDTKKLCHWNVDSSVAKIVRLIFDRDKK